MDNAQVLLVFANPVLFPSAQPYGAMALASTLERKGIRARVFLPFMDENPTEALRRVLRVEEPKIVGFSFRNLDTAGFHYEDDGEDTFLPDLAELVALCNRARTVTVVGGAGFAIAPAEILKTCGADAGFVGPSEDEFATFCQRVLFENADVERAVRGLKSAFLRGQPAPHPQNDRLLAAGQFHSAALEYAKMVGGTVPVRTKAGCSLRCTYCVVPSIERLILRPWSDIRREFREIVEAGLQERVFIADAEFNLPTVNRAIALCQQIRHEFGNTIKWRCYLEAGYVTGQLLEAMRDSGCVGVSLTVDALAEPSRRGFAKGTKPETAVEAMRLCLESGIETRINLLFGGPNETLETARQTALTARDFNTSGIIVAVTVGLRVYPGTPFAKQVTLPRYAPHFRPCKRTPWLGVFCSPVPPSELARHVISILPPSPTIPYTNTIRRADKGFYSEVAWATTRLVERQFAEAQRMFDELQQKYPERMEPKLGVLKAEVGAESPQRD